MNKYNFSVGDYVETKQKQKGYIEDISEDTLAIEVNFSNKLIRYDIDPEDGKAFMWDGTSHHWINFKEVFTRIGQYDFTLPKIKNKIEPLKDINVYSSTIATKLNEVINYINSKENEKQ